MSPPGVGKSHLAISLAIAAAQSGRRVYYGTLADLITSLEEAQQAGRLGHRLTTLIIPSLLVDDEIVYLPITRTGAMLFFQLMSQRHERADRPHRPARAPLPHRQHLGQQLPDEETRGARRRAPARGAGPGH